MRRWLITLFAITALIWPVAAMAGSITITGQDLGNRGNLRVLKWHIDCDDYDGTDIPVAASGWAYDSTNGPIGDNETPITGKVRGYLWVPATGSTCGTLGNSACYPDDNGDFEIREADKNMADILNGAGDDVPDGADSGDEDYMFKNIVDTLGGFPTVHDAVLNFFCTNMFATNSNFEGDLFLYIEMF